MDPYNPQRSADRGCFSFSCGCCSGGCLIAVLLGSLSVLVFSYGYWIGMVEHPGNFAYIHVLGDDMEPTLSPGDWILVDRTQYLEEPIERGDIVWFISPGETEAESKQFLRVAGLPNESISFNATGELMVTGARFTRHPFLSERDFRLNNKPPEPLQLGENQYYLLGDNRSRARDSRGVGAIERKSLRGKAVSVLFPPNRVGKLLDSN